LQLSFYSKISEIDEKKKVISKAVQEHIQTMQDNPKKSNSKIVSNTKIEKQNNDNGYYDIRT
jgi:hypothetical protein